MRKYRDRPMNLADAVLVGVAQRKRLRKALTLDHGDWQAYRSASGVPFTLIPESVVEQKDITAARMLEVWTFALFSGLTLLPPIHIV